MYLISLLVFGFAIVVISDSVPTVFKCCPDGDFLSDDLTCKRTDRRWQPDILAEVYGRFHTPEELVDVLKKWTVDYGLPKCGPNLRPHLAKKLTNNSTHPYFFLFWRGDLWLAGETFSDPKSFCVDYDTAVACVKDETEFFESPAEQVKRVYIKKCCEQNEKYSLDFSRCLGLGRKQDLNLTQFLQNTTSLNVLNISNTGLDVGFPVCEDGLIMTGNLSDHNSSLQQDGSLYLPTAKVVLEPRTFCLEYIQESRQTVPTIFTCPNYLPVPLNGSHIAPDQSDLRLTMYSLGMFFSVFFLAATLATGCLLPTTHHMLHWRCQTCHVACLMAGDLLLAISYIAGHRYPTELCKASATMILVLFLAAFFWLNTMCFNIWWTFRDLRPTSMDKGQEAWRLRMYELYAWGCPLIIAVTAVVFDNLPQDFPSVLRPKFGAENCWFSGDAEIFTYFYGPVGILLFLNLILFVLTARELTCGLWKSEVVKSTTERATLGRVCLKLVVVMGITWIADIASWAVGGPQYLWYVTDVINTLHGVFIFIVVGCQPQIWAAVKRLWCFKDTTTTTSVNGNPQSCSQDVPSIGDSVSNNTQNTSIKMPSGETPC